MAQNVALSRTDAFETQPQGLPLKPFFPRLLVTSKGLPHSVEENLQESICCPRTRFETARSWSPRVSPRLFIPRHTRCQNHPA